MSVKFFGKFVSKLYKLNKPLIYLIALTILLWVISCSVEKRVNSTNYHLLNSPPNGVKIGDNLYCDKTEISNVAWLEYLYWLGRVHGFNSRTYRAALPDTTVWVQVDSSLAELSTNYLREKAYHDYPVVGVSQEQAQDYSKWRSDRVFEGMLIENGVIDYEPDQDEEMYFTIERYFKGTFNGISPDTNYKYYPTFRLPTLAERERIINFTDSVTNALDAENKMADSRENYSDYVNVQVNKRSDLEETIIKVPIRRVRPIEASNDMFFNLKDNVSEWTVKDNICAGWNWGDKIETVQSGDTTRLSGVNALTGFRNISQWEKVKCLLSNK